MFASLITVLPSFRSNTRNPPVAFPFISTRLSFGMPGCRDAGIPAKNPSSEFRGSIQSSQKLFLEYLLSLIFIIMAVVVVIIVVVVVVVVVVVRNWVTESAGNPAMEMLKCGADSS